MSANRSSSKEKKKSLDLDWENRVLCSDGNCIGVIGADGLCKECGKACEGRLPENMGHETSPAAPETPSQPEIKAADTPVSSSAEPDSAKQPAGDDEWENRVLCSDGNCIGVIGDDGRCKECGKANTPESSK